MLCEVLCDGSGSGARMAAEAGLRSIGERRENREKEGRVVPAVRFSQGWWTYRKAKYNTSI